MNLNGTDYYVRNAQGDIIGLIDKAGSEVVNYTYDSWGKLVSIDGSLKDAVRVKNPYRYRGYRYDSETGLYYLQSRYYNAEVGRFLNINAILGDTGEILSHNLFSYCENNQVNFVDNDGYCKIRKGFKYEFFWARVYFTHKEVMRMIRYLAVGAGVCFVLQQLYLQLLYLSLWFLKHLQLLLHFMGYM